MLKIFNSLFGFSKKERTGIYLLILISSGIWILPLFFAKNEIDLKELNITPIQLEKNRLILSKQRNTDSIIQFDGNNIPKIKTVKGTDQTPLFTFNPNKIGKDAWLKLGLREKTAETILNYIAKGGRFEKKEDLGKIYGLSGELLKRIMPYSVFQHHDSISKRTNYTHKEIITKPKIDLNRADSAALVGLPGIGHKLAFRIIQYRERLGGFITVNQLTEVYGISDSLLINISELIFLESDKAPKKININAIVYDDLIKHPYVTYAMAKIILAYRRSHGKINGTDELLNIAGIDKNKIEKLIAYFVFED